MFHLLSSMVRTVPRGMPEGGQLVSDPLMVLVLDCTNAFNTLSKQGLLNCLQEGCEKHGGTTEDQNQPVGWDLLWSYIHAHYGVKGVLKYYHAGKVHVFSSEAGVHQGDPLASTLVALAIHPIIIKVAEDDNVVITAYSDNIIMTGKMSVVRRAAVVCRDLMATMNLKLNQTPRLPLLYPPARARLHPPTWPSPFHQPIHTHTILQTYPFPPLPKSLPGCIVLLLPSPSPLRDPGLQTVRKTDGI